jgi:hypothetical protein
VEKVVRGGAHRPSFPCFGVGNQSLSAPSIAVFENEDFGVVEKATGKSGLGNQKKRRLESFHRGSMLDESQP